MTTPAEDVACLEAALHRQSVRLVEVEQERDDAIRAREVALGRARQAEDDVHTAWLRVVHYEDTIENAKQAARLEAYHAKADAAEDVAIAEAQTRHAYDVIHETRAELAAAYRAASDLRRGVPRWLVPTCAGIGAAKRVAEEWRDRAIGLTVRARRALASRARNG